MMYSQQRQGRGQQGGFINQQGMQAESSKLGTVINNWLQKEVSYAGQDEVRRRDTGDEPPVRENYYASMFLRQKTLSTPPLVQRLKSQCKVSWQIKVFPNLFRAAALVDEHVFLWNYETGRDPVMYTAPSVVTCIDFVRPKPGVFEPHVDYVMIVCTFSSIEMAAIHVRDPRGNELSLQKLPDYQLTTGNTIMQCITSYESQCSDSPPRTFFGGNDGCVYELQYTARDGWMKNRIRLQNLTSFMGSTPVIGNLIYMARDSLSSFWKFGGIADLQIDSTRNYLYALDSRGNLTLWWLGSDDDTILCEYQCSKNVTKNGVNPVSIHPVPAAKSSRHTEHDLLSVLYEDGTRVPYSVSISYDGRTRDLSTNERNYNSDVSSCSVAMFSQLDLRTAHLGPLETPFPVDQIIHTGPVDNSTARSFVNPRVSILIPRNHQQQPQLLCTAQLGIDSQGSGNVVSIVDLKPLIRQADTWRQGELPTVGINIFSVVEEEWAGNLIHTSASDLIAQVVRPPSRYIIAHSVGITFLTRLRPVDMIHIALRHPQSRQGIINHIQQTSPQRDLAAHQFDYEWLLQTYGKVEVSVMLLSLICSEQQGPGHLDGHNSFFNNPNTDSGYPGTGGSSEDLLAFTLSSPPSQDVVQRAQEQFTMMGSSGHAALFQYFARAVASLWSTPFISPFWEQLWMRKQFSLFVNPLEGLRYFLSQLVGPTASDIQQLYNPHTDCLLPGPIQNFLLQYECYSDIYDQIVASQQMGGMGLHGQQQPQPAQDRPDNETIKNIEALTRRGLFAVVERTVEALKILKALEDLSPQDRQTVVTKIRGMELGRVVHGQHLSDESESFTDALMGELLQLPPHAVDRIWASWRECKYFFDPAAVDFYEARKRILSPSPGNANVIADALRQLEKPDVAPCLLRRQVGQVSGVMRLNVICQDLRKIKQYMSAMYLAMTAAKHCDPENRAEYWHAAVAEPASVPNLDPSSSVLGNNNLPEAAETSQLYFNARRRAYYEILLTLDLLFSTPGSLETEQLGSESLASIKAQRAIAIDWAFGKPAALYYEAPHRSVARPILSGELLTSQDKLLHYHIYLWLASRADGEGVWPSRSDLSHCRPHRQQLQHPHNVVPSADSLQHFLSAGHFAVIQKQPLQSWTNQFTESWARLWSGWHIGLLSDLADYCEARNEGCMAAHVRLCLAHSSADVLLASPDFQRSAPNCLPARIDVLLKAEASAQRDTTANGRHLNQYLQSQRPSAIAQIQKEMLSELACEAWVNIADADQQECAGADSALLQGELVPADKLYEMIHISYADFIPHLAIKLLRVLGIERPELKQIIKANIPQMKVADFVIKSITKHMELIDTQGQDAISNAFARLQDAAGVDQGITHHIEPRFLSLQLVISGLEEMAMRVLDARGQPIIPSNCLFDDATSRPGIPVSPVPTLVGPSLGWPSSRILYDAYRALWNKVIRSHTQDLFPQYRGCQVDDMVRRQVSWRLMAILCQLCLHWLNSHLQNLRSTTDVQQLSREYVLIVLMFSEDVEQMHNTVEGHQDTPLNVRQIIEASKRELRSFSAKVHSVQGPTRVGQW